MMLNRGTFSLKHALCLGHSLLLAAILMPTTAHAEVVLFDGFGDADLNNDGNIAAREDVDMDRDMELGSTYEAPDFAGSVITEVSTALDPSDTGARWLFSRGWTGSVSPGPPPEFQPKANIKIMDDSAGAFPDSTHASYPVPSLDSGYAMAYDSKGRGSSATAFFGETIALGPEVGDQVKVSFDFRVWLSGPNQNSQNPPRNAALRFGLFEDTDNQIGTVNPFAGMPDPSNGIPTAATWGVDGGHFRGDFGTVGANEDHGWYANVDLGRADFLGDGAVAPVAFDGLGARINEETNEAASNGRFLEGSDNDFVAKTDEMAPTFTALDVTKAYNLALTLERATDLTEADTIRAIFTVEELGTGQTWTIEGTEPIMDSMGMPDGISSDKWDYFGIRNTTPLSSVSSDGDDFDFILDNFMVEIFGSNASDIGPDFNGDMLVDCLDVDALVGEIVGGTNDAAFDLTGDGVVDGADLTEWLAQAGAENLPSGNSYLFGDANLDGVVDGQDFVVWNGSKFTATAAWCSGDFNADGNVDGQDFILWNQNKFTSSADGFAVPEPALGLAAGLMLLCLRRRRGA